MKIISRPQYYRVRRILEMIREGVRTGEYPNCIDFCRDLQVSRPTVTRDLDFLKYEENAPIEYLPASFGYTLTDRTWTLPPVQVSRSEVFAFSIARKLIERFKGTPLEMDMQSVLDKIGESLKGNVILEGCGLTDNFTVLGEDYVKQNPEIWKKVSGLVERRELMKVYYQQFDGQCGWYELEPYHLISYRGNWYVLARERRGGPDLVGRIGICEVGEGRDYRLQRGKESVGRTEEKEKREKDADRLRTYPISRFRTVEPTGRHFQIPHGFKVEDHVETTFGIIRGDKVINVRLLFTPKVATYIKERVWQPSQKIIERRDGGIELRMKTAGWKELVRWILSWQPDVRVLAPAKLRKRIAEKLMEGLGKA